MEKQVFISYSKEDRDTADRIAFVLLTRNIGCWIDHRDIKPGDIWPSHIPEAIEKSQVVVLIFSAAANRSKWVEREINHAFTEHKTIIPFRIGNVTPQGTFKLLKSNAQWQEASNPPRPVDIEALAKVVKEHLDKLKPMLVAPTVAGLTNPFVDLKVVQDPERFIERPTVMHVLMSYLSSGGSVALQGEPKIGKSSLLRSIARTWKEAGNGEVLGPLDCQSLLDAEDFYGAIAGALGLENSDRRGIRDALNQGDYLFLLDELDFAPKCGITHNDMAFFRAILSSNRKFKMMAVSRGPVKNIYEDIDDDSKIYSVMLPVTLGPLTENEARQLLAHPWAPDAPHFDEIATIELIELTACHPFKLQRAAHHRFDSLADPGYDWRSWYSMEMEQML
jgi:hypothetical protein